jgi:nucleotide-binding universal stress UspA family protein
MEKLTSILVIAEGVASGAKILHKAIVLARGFGARVELLIRDSRDTKEYASLCSTHAYDEVILCSVFLGAEPFEDAILRRIFETSPDLVVKAMTSAARDASSTFGRADQRLAAECPVPLLLMREEAWRSPVRIAAAVDVSGERTTLARGIVHTAGFLSLGLEGELDVIYSEREQQDEVLRMARAVKLARVVREFHVQGEQLRRIDGAPDETLPTLAASGEYDVLVLGAVTHREGFAAIHEKLTGKLVRACKGDVVLIKEEQRSADQRHHGPLTSRAAS